MKLITYLFPVWAIVFSVVAYFFPQPFIQARPAIIPLLAIIMFGMGITLTIDDFRRVIKRPRILFLGIAAQFLLMPFMAYAISAGLGLSTALLTGMILVGASSGGTASNVICYLAKGDVALSISLTFCSTLVAVIAMPLLTLFYIGEKVPVPVSGMLLSVLQIVIAPVAMGVLLNYFLGKRLQKVIGIFPLISVICIVVIITIIVALNEQRLGQIGGILILAVILHNLAGLISGYGMATLFGYDSRIRRTLAIEIGMQNSGLSVALASQFFSPLAALPGALFSIWHNISGSLLASFWTRPNSEGRIAKTGIYP